MQKLAEEMTKMTLLLSTIAATVCTILWYRNMADDKMKIATLALIYWGSSLMWFVDAVFEYRELKTAYFTPDLTQMLNDGFLGVSIITLGMMIWIFQLIISKKNIILRNKN